jgi:5'-methylthioinosine phosphorylase
VKKVAIIGGTGLYDFPGLANVSSLSIDTPYGQTSAALVQGNIADLEVVFLARHGNPHAIPPHKINYRANVWALKNQGVDGVVAVNAVGGISKNMQAGVICIPDQIIDYTYGREHTYSDSADVALEHVDFSYPYDELMRSHILKAAQGIQLALEEKGVYAATQGPRLESAAEINRLDRDGADIVGMTAMPEAALCRELGLPYSAICLVVNPAAGRSAQIITMEDIEKVMASGMGRVMSLLESTLKMAAE